MSASPSAGTSAASSSNSTSTAVQKSVCGGAFHARGLRETTLGGAFHARGLRETTLGGVSAIVPYVSCSDVHITGFNHLIVEENDKLKNGFVSW